MSDRVIHLVPVLADDVLAIGRRFLPAGFELRPIAKADLPATCPRSSSCSAWSRAGSTTTSSRPRRAEARPAHERRLRLVQRRGRPQGARAGLGQRRRERDLGRRAHADVHPGAAQAADHARRERARRRLAGWRARRAAHPRDLEPDDRHLRAWVGSGRRSSSGCARSSRARSSTSTRSACRPSASATLGVRYLSKDELLQVGRRRHASTCR